MKIVIVAIVCMILGAAAYTVYQQPKGFFSTLRDGIDKAEQLQVAECRESFIAESQCYQKFKQDECERRMVEKCGKIKK